MHILFWGRDGNYGPDYPRNRVVRESVAALGHTWTQFKPVLSPLADIEAVLRGVPTPDVVWVPCFRQRDVQAASRWAHRRGVPVVFDPLISAWDKQVNERAKFSADSVRSHRLLATEAREFAAADVIVADTDGHARFFAQTLRVPEDRLVVIPVGAEESLFQQQAPPERAATDIPELIFFGTFIGLHGIETLLDAIDLYEGPPVRWRLLGDGPLRETCIARLARWKNENPALDIAIEGWRPLSELPARLAQADALFGIFGTSAKAVRVIPNKVYQTLAIGRPVITSSTEAYPVPLRADENHGVLWCPPGDATALAKTIERFVARRSEWPAMARAARATYEEYFSAFAVKEAVDEALRMATALPTARRGGR